MKEGIIGLMMFLSESGQFCVSDAVRMYSGAVSFKEIKCVEPSIDRIYCFKIDRPDNIRKCLKPYLRSYNGGFPK